MTPLQKWQQGERERILEHPADPGQLDVIMAHSAGRRVFHYGVEINGLRYNSAELQVLRRRYGQNLDVRLKYDDEDVGHIHVFDSDQKAYIKVYANDRDYADGLLLIQHETIRAKLREDGKDPGNRLNLLRKKEELRDLIETAVFSKKMAQRKRAQVHRGTNSVHNKKIGQTTDQSHPVISDFLPAGMAEETPPKFTVRERMTS